MTTAIHNQGCYLNGEALEAIPENTEKKVSWTSSNFKNINVNERDNEFDYGYEAKASNTKLSSSALSSAIVNVGFPVVQNKTLIASAKTISALCTKVRGIRMFACASQVMAWVAQGKLQAYVSWDLNAWDVAAGMLIVREAGGDVYDMRKYKDKKNKKESGEEEQENEASVDARDMVVTSFNKKQLRDELLEILDENDCLSY